MSEEQRNLQVVPKCAFASTSSPSSDGIFGDNVDAFDSEAEGVDDILPHSDLAKPILIHLSVALHQRGP